MKQIRYIAFALSLLAVGVIIYLIAQPFLNSELIAERKEQPYDYTTSDTPKKPVVSINSEGGILFSNNCQTCHALDKNITGPALRGVEERGPWRDRANLVKWIQNPGKFSADDPYAKGLIMQYGQLMTAFPQLTKEQIFSIFDYIKGAPMPGSFPVAVR